MRLKSLRLAGFKSFADRTEFQLPDGITCVVGPNGCGKSNVVDALKWVLGEQRPTALRGTEMGDVIFGGTAARKPLGVAEVTLVLDNADRSLPLDFAEIEVTRRLYRDGGSEYLLNRSPCRLRDLRELLMDTGSGPGAMSVMEQGRIDQILKESVEERRAVFEEAAGVAKYKARRKEALRKLERVEADLLRVTDVVAEKERLVRSLKIQAGRAERYQALVDEMRGKRLVIALHRYGQLMEERGAAAARVADLSTSEETARGQVRDALAASRRGEEELDERRQAIVRKEQETSSLQSQADTAREKSAFAARLAAELDGKIRWYVGEIDSSSSRLEELAKAGEDAVTALAAAEAERAERTRDVADAERGIESARTVAHERRAVSQRLAERAYENLSRQSRLGSLRSKLEAESRALTDRDDRLRKRRGSLDEEVARTADRLQRAEADATSAAAAREASATSLSTAETRAHDLESQLRTLREHVATADRDVSSTRSRVEVLRALEARMEGVGDGPRRYLEAAKKDPSVPQVRGLVADLLEADTSSAHEVETALGAYAQALVVATFEDAELAVRAVRDRKLPRCVFLPLDAVTPRAERSPVGSRRLADAVRCDPAMRPLVEALLGDAVIAEDVAAARAARAADTGLRVVLSDGTLLDAVGALAGGGAAGGAGLLQRRGELRELTAKLDEAVLRLEAARAALASSENELAGARREISASRDALRTADAALHRAHAEADRARGDTQRLANERTHLEREAEEIDSEIDRVGADVARAAEESDRAAHEQAEIETYRGEAAKELEHAERALRAAEDRRGDARVHLASVAERVASLQSRVQAVRGEIADLEESVRDARGELSACEERKVEAEERGREAQKAFEQAHRRRESCVQELAVLRHEASAAHSALEQRRSLLEQLEAEATRVAHELHRFRMQEHEARVRVENLIERARDELNADLHEAWERRRAEAPESAGESAPVYAEGAEPTPQELESLESQVAELRQRIEKMGAVNLEALTQLQDADREATTLRAQHDDLVRSRESLLQAIKRIDQESRELFLQTFAKVRANFQEMFRRLFGGGKADVFLTEGQDVLEAGIEVVAKPPGKEQRSISLLSGGERTMTAVALLFAIYIAKPSPFCLMDEVDAALDENNIDRFVGVLREFAQQSQFVIVSHNKRTISAAGTIFGVSMPEPGISRKFAVRLDDIAEDGQLRPAEAVAS